MSRWHAARENPFLSENAVYLDYVSVLKELPQVIDYLSSIRTVIMIKF